MNCQQFEEQVVDLAREERDEGREEALAHAERCESCAARLDDERAVTSALRAFAGRTAGAEAPPRIEAALRRALSEPEAAGGATKTSPSRAIELLLLAAAAAILAAIVVVPPPIDRFPERASATIPPGLPEGTDESADFVALRYGEDLRDLDSLQVVSVELPPTALAALGWPAGDGGASWVTAEVIVGHDGVARAIRFVE